MFTWKVNVDYDPHIQSLDHLYLDLKQVLYISCF